MLWIFSKFLKVFVECFLADIDGGGAPIRNKQLFLSYGREPEVKSFVVQLKHDLEKRGFGVWLDVEDIPAGIMNTTDGLVS